MILQPDLEALPAPRLRALQADRLAEVVRLAYERVPLYTRRFDEIGVKPDDISGLADLGRLPFTKKSDLRDTYPFGMFAVPMSEVVRIHASTGTTGHPTVVGYTRDDLEVFATVCARALAAAGATPGMILHNAYGYGLFTGGLGFHAGGERLGLAVLPVSGGSTSRQVDLMLDFRPEVLACTPSYALTLAEELARRGVAPEQVPVRFAVLGAEPWTESMRREIDRLLGARSTNCYGLSEIVGPGVAFECSEARRGSHVAEDHFLAEVVDPDTGSVLPDGEVGVLVVTTLSKRALPLLRYWTGDVTSLSREPCPCGRTFAKMSSVRGRTDDMLIVRGVNVYPTQIEAILGTFAELTPNYRLVVTRPGTLDEMRVEVELVESLFRSVAAEMLSEDELDAHHALAGPREALTQAIKSTVGVSAKVRFLAPGTAPRSQGGKLGRVVDERRLD
ncbi:MAG TPA: phenylacetate--CoA ligase [Acidimicrobiales bacterium]|nr:phenylacetate--CoA ligase [Acidimicrobiales bacterium]